MENLEKYYTAIDRELLELATYFKNELLRLKEIAPLSEGDESSLQIIINVPDMVNNGAKRRMEAENEKIKREAMLWEGRKTVYCFNCKEERKVSIKGERKNPKTGWKCDLVKCSVCKKQFVSVLPNNRPDQNKYYKNFYEQLITVREDGQTYAERFAKDFNSEEELKDYANSLEAEKAAEKATNEFNIAVKNVDAIIENLRDTLLKEKLSKVNWQNNIGLA